MRVTKRPKDKPAKVAVTYGGVLEAFVRTPPPKKPAKKKESASTGETQALPAYKSPNFVDDCIDTVDKLLPNRPKK